MITRTLFRKNYIIFASIILVFIVIAISSAWIFTSFERDQMHMGPANLNRDLLKVLDDDPLIGIEKLNKLAQQGKRPPHDLINAGGVSLLSGKTVSSPLSPNQISELQRENLIFISNKDLGAPTVLAPTTKGGIYLYSTMSPPQDRPKPIGPLVTLAALIICVLISIGVALFYQFSKYNERSLEAFTVLNSLREGNLSARLPTKKFDELHSLTQAFNQMAGDVEKMVEQLRTADQSRRQLLQDLAHDLRTPLTSLKTFLETMQMAGDQLSEKKRQEVLTLCLSEVLYFGKLVEDLLFLAQITEPKYSLGTEKIDLIEKINEQISVFKERHPHIQFEVQDRAKNIHIMGSGRLIERLLRNAFDNSSSFAKSKLIIEISECPQDIRVSFFDDGPGFSEKALSEFGQKKASRVLVDAQQGQRISVGIGSVIMKEISMLHSGTIHAENRQQRSQIVGAKVSLIFNKI